MRKVQFKHKPVESSIPNIRLSRMANAGNQGMEYDVIEIRSVSSPADRIYCRLF